MKLKAAFLEITSWDGISIGAEHYYGAIYFNHEKHELKRKMTQDEADKLNRKDRWSSYKKGTLTERFDSEKELIRIGKSYFKKNFKDVPYLVLGKSGVIEPQPIIVGSGKEVDRINELTTLIYTEELWKEWYELAKKIGVAHG